MRPTHHAGDHTWDGEDSIPVEWHGLTLVNSWSAIAGYPPPRFGFLPGIDPETGEPKLELELAVQGGQPGTVIATIKLNGVAVTFAYNKPPFLVPDNAGGVWPITVKANGDILDGIA